MTTPDVVAAIALALAALFTGALVFCGWRRDRAHAERQAAYARARRDAIEADDKHWSGVKQAMPGHARDINSSTEEERHGA